MKSTASSRFPMQMRQGALAVTTKQMYCSVNERSKFLHAVNSASSRNYLRAMGYEQQLVIETMWTFLLSANLVV